MKQLLHKLSSLRLLMLLAVLLGVSGAAWADEAYYTLDTTNDANKTDNNGYGYSGTATVGDIEWTFEGNGNMNPWRLGGKNLTEQDRAVYTNTPMGAAISSINLRVGAASSITVNSLRLVVASDASFANVLDAVTGTFAANSTITFEPTSASSWDEDSYYKFIFNVSVSGNSNRFVEFSKVEFYAYSSLQDCDLALTGAPVALNFDLYNSSAAQTVTFTTSSTGNVTVSGGEGYVTTAVSGNTITVTPTAVTPSAQTIIVSQAADDNYKAGQVTFTVFIDDSTPLPTHTATFSINGTTSSQDFEEGAAIVFPSDPADISDKTFVGWVTDAISGVTDVEPSFVTSETMGYSDVTYYAVFADVTAGTQTTITDNLTSSTFGSPSSYTTWSGKSATNGSDAVYAGNSTTKSSSDTAIQIRAQSPSGIVSTTSGGKVKKVTVKWNAGTSTGRSLDVYGKNTAYTEAANLYGTATVQGTKIGSIVYGTSTELTISDDYEYIGMRSNNGAMYLDQISIEWSTGTPDTYSSYCTTVVAAAVERPTINVAANPFLFSTTATITCETDGAAIKYSYDNENWNDYSEALTITSTTTLYAKAVKNSDESSVASVEITKNLAEPTVTINADGITNTNVFEGTEAGSLAATVTYNEAAVEGAEVTWSGNNDEVATIDAATGAVTLLAAGTVTFTATYAGNSDYSEKTATYEMTVTNTDPNAPGTEKNPYTVAQARAAIDAGTGITNVYATGIVSQAGTVNGSGQISYYISADGSTTSDQLQAYKGRGIDGASFESDDDIQVGDVVVIYGTLKKYNAIYEFDQNNQLVSLFRKTTPGLEWSEASFTAKNGEENAYPTLTNTNGVTVTYSSTDEAVATIDASTGVITLVANGNTTIKATFAGNEDYLAQEVSYELTVKGFSKDAAGINFIEESYEFVYNDDDYTAFEGQALTNPNNLDVVWSSDDEEVAIVDDTTGEVVLGQPGTATITATFTEDEDYLGSVVSYTITINKAEAGLSFDGTSFMVAPNGDFTEPTFNNPNDLTVEWTSTNEDVASVYGGEVLIGSKEGTATITASFAGNDYYNAGNASYTITVSNILLQTWDLSTKSYSAASEDEVDWTSANVTMIATKYDASTPADNYLGGDANERTSSRFYKNSKLTITPAAGYQISSVEFTATSTSYATALNNSAWTNAKAIVSGTTVTVTPVYGSKAFEAVIGGTCGFTSVTVTYQVQTQETVVIGTAGYTSFTTEFDVNFEGTGVTAYIATAVNSETIHLESVTEAPAGTALILQAAPETYLLNSDCEGTTDLSSNLLLSSDGTVEGDGSTIYALGVGKEAPYTDIVGFYVVNDGQTVPAGKAYLDLSASSVKEFLTFDFGELPTGLNDVRSKMEDVSGDIFNLAGQKMNRLQKGINIVNGKKVLVK